MSKFPPSCGLVSSIRLEIALSEASPAVNTDLVIFLSPPPEASIANNISPLAAVAISDKSVITVGLKFVPSAISKAPAVLAVSYTHLTLPTKRIV